MIGETDHICLPPLAVMQWGKPLCISSQTEVSLKRLLISGFAAVALLAFATAWRSHSSLNDAYLTTIGMASLKKSPAAAGKPALPVEEFEDMSLVFSTPSKP